MIKELLPPETRMSCQASDLIIQLSMHYLHYLSDRSNVVCNLDEKKTITPSHVAKALKVRIDSSKKMMQDLKMDCYLSKILELGIEEGNEVNLSEKQTKDIINQKMQGT